MVCCAYRRVTFFFFFTFSIQYRSATLGDVKSNLLPILPYKAGRKIFDEIRTQFLGIIGEADKMGAEADEPQLPESRENPNRITPSQFLSWKRQKDAEASAKKAEAARKRAEDIAADQVQMNGRELFIHEPWVFDNARY